MRYYYCGSCDTGYDEVQVGPRRICPQCRCSMKLTATEIVAYNNFMRQRDGDPVHRFSVTGEILEWCKDLAEEDSSIHVDSLMDLAHDQEKLDLIEFLLVAGLTTDYLFLED